MLIPLYSRTNGKLRSRQTENLCEKFFLQALDGKKTPYHSTLDRFIKKYTDEMDGLFYEMVKLLGNLGELTKNVVL